MNPYVVIGRELRRRGHRVTLIATEVFADVVSKAGLAFVSSASRDEYERATSNPDLWSPRRGLAVVLELLSAQLRRGYELIESVYEPNETILVGHPLSFFTRVFEETHRTPAATVHLAPSIFRSDFRQPVLPTGSDISWWPRWAKRMLWWGVDRLAVDPLILPQLNAWRAELRLAPVSRVFNAWVHSPQRVVGLFPDWFGEPQPDWPSQLRLAGFVLSDEGCAPVREDARIEQFVAAGDPPVVFTPGSANRHAEAFFQTAIDATASLRRRALLVTGYREQLPSILPDHVQHASYASFSTLFARAAAVVHHGGIGTCAQGLAAGVPQLVMPMGFDQPDNAARLVRLGVGATISRSRFSPTKVAESLNHLLATETVRAKCQHWRERIADTDGVAAACDAIEERGT